MRQTLVVGLVLVLAQATYGGMVISEWMYSGTDGEFVEFTNIGPDAVDMTGWSFDDDSQTPGTVDLSGFGVVDVGTSVILTEAPAADFATAWGFAVGGSQNVIGDLSANLGRNDQINLYDADDNLIDQLSYGDEDYPGTVRTNGASCNIPATDYTYAEAQTGWVLATVGDFYDSRTSTGGDIGSPGIVIPEPATLALVALGGLLIARRRA